jgi:uncharacterized repeat protein (TIGR02543 family)
LFARAVPNAGYALSGWTGDAMATTNPIRIPLDRSKTIGANFEPGFTVAVTQTDGGVVNYSSRKTVYAAGTVLDLQAVPAPGFEFAGWSGSVTNTQPTVEIVIDKNINLFARFRAPIKHALWNYVSPSSALFDPVVDDHGQIYAIDQRGVVALDPSGNLSWRTITADGTTTTNVGIAIERSGTIRVVSAAQTTANLQTLKSQGDFVGGTTSIPMPPRGIGVDAEENLYLGGPRIVGLDSNDATRWEFRGNTDDEQNDAFVRLLSRPALDKSGHVYFSGVYATAAGGATRIYGRTAGNSMVFASEMRKPLVPLDLGGPAVIDFTAAKYKIDSSPIIGIDRIYFIDFDGSLVAMRLDGAVAWRYATLDVFSTPSIDVGETIYVGARNSNRFYALNSDGTIKWIRAPGVGNYSAPAIGVDGTIYVSDSAALYALNSAGDRIWEFDAPVSAPVISGNHLYATGDALYAFDLTAKGPAQSPWPMRGASARNDAMAIDIQRPPEFDRAALSYIGGVFHVRVTGSSGTTITLYTSTDLRTWTIVEAKSVVNGVAEFEHAISAQISHWYKAAVQ